jgi:hypothetical protein
MASATASEHPFPKRAHLHQAGSLFAERFVTPQWPAAHPSGAGVPAVSPEAPTIHWPVAGEPQTIPVGSAVAMASKVKGTWTHIFWLTWKEQNGTGMPGHAPIIGSPTQKVCISPTVTSGLMVTIASTHTLSWTVVGHGIFIFTSFEFISL